MGTSTYKEHLAFTDGEGEYACVHTEGCGCEHMFLCMLGIGTSVKHMEQRILADTHNHFKLVVFRFGIVVL